MYYGLASVLCFAVLFIVMACSSLFCAAGLWAAGRLFRALAPRPRANWLFALRVLPLFLALVLTIAFALPAFLRFEPHSTREMIGLRLLVLSGAGAAALIAIGLRALVIVRSTRRAQQLWRQNSQPYTASEVKADLYCTSGAAPLLAVTGIFRPRIFVARKVTEHLSRQELAAAIAHELAHVSALDNLKQLVLKITRPPQWFSLFRNSDAAWLNASEMAADEGAVAKGASSLELSSALVKVGRLSRQTGISSMVAASHLLPVAAESCIQMRVAHLQKLLETDQPIVSHQHANRFWILSVLALGIAYMISVNAILPWVHDALELLVR
jgi:Zn-dependent protease with chaperone function